MFGKRRQAKAERDELEAACNRALLWALDNAMLTRYERKYLSYRRRTYGWNHRFPSPGRPPFEDGDDRYV